MLWIASLVGSGFLWLYSQVTRVTPIEAGQLSSTFECLATRAREESDEAGVAAIETEVYRLLTRTLTGLRDGSVSYDGFDAFQMTFDLAREAIAERRQELSGSSA